ncbi:hypothetical protein MTR62_13785 [Novosphingobium sp. 1949]|uniref:Uncharacterized protein n=1 Tax=Novosphingobium organovorum TaxID=2930092 RepID=A0ABT0BFW8_9SPHN|nr:hypothetical protein [Novosphingobium organovorum]MCJ2183753.1 hypothetical protein [Novosphingobium organovorum]
MKKFLAVLQSGLVVYAVAMAHSAVSLAQELGLEDALGTGDGSQPS